MSAPLLTKTCNSCGLQKPLSAFLQLTGQQGNIYGNICSTCRRSQQDKPPKEPEETTRRQAGGSRIGSDERKISEINKEKQRTDEEERYHEDREEQQAEQSEKNVKVEKIYQSEKSHRFSLLDKQRVAKTKDITVKVFGGLEQTAKENEINLTAPVIDTHIPGKEKYKGLFNQWKKFLGASAPIAAAEAKEVKKPAQEISRDIGKTAFLSRENKKTVDAAKESSPSEFIEKNWTPSKKR